jgi:hypothetical protein
MPPAAKPVCVSRPLLAREGARFTCFSDGLCCTDIHALGPLSRAEVRSVRALIPDAVYLHPGVGEPCMVPGLDGDCAQREAGLCGVHKRFGAQAKPAGCRRFPYGLLSTPEGGRITTEHRCPCRTLGDRPPLSLSDAERSLSNGQGRLEPDRRAPLRVPVGAGRFWSFARYRKVEGAYISRLLAGQAPEAVLAATVRPELHVGDWDGLVQDLYDASDGSSGGEAICWYADALAHLGGRTPTAGRERPWAAAFDRGIARSLCEADPAKMIADWVADELWQMRWLGWDCTFDVARAELATRVAMVRWLVERLGDRQVRADQAAAEAIMIVELGACYDQWSDLVAAIANDPSPATRLD